MGAYGFANSKGTTQRKGIWGLPTVGKYLREKEGPRACPRREYPREGSLKACFWSPKTECDKRKKKSQKIGAAVFVRNFQESRD